MFHESSHECSPLCRSKLGGRTPAVVRGLRFRFIASWRRSWRYGWGLVRLAFVRSHVAAASVLCVGTRLAALIRLQQMTVTIGAAARVARINCRASREQSLSLCRPAVVLQRPELGIGIVQVASIVEVAAAIAAQVVAI